MIESSLLKRGTVVVLIVCGLVCGSHALADTTGGIRGTVVDEATGNVAVGAKITVDSPQYVGHATSGRGGFFVLLGLPPDDYVVSLVLRSGRRIYCPIIMVPVAAGQVRTIPLVAFESRGLLSCGFRRFSATVVPDETSDVYSFGQNGIP